MFVTTPFIKLLDLEQNVVEFGEELLLLRPSLRRSSHAYSRCQVAIVITPDFARVFVGEGENEFPQVAFEADGVALEALAERFEFLELRRALALRVEKGC